MAGAARQTNAVSGMRDRMMSSRELDGVAEKINTIIIRWKTLQGVSPCVREPF
jgi:hypothetical protein